MMAFNLLMIAISGIAAIVSGESLQSSIERVTHRSVLNGTLDSFYYTTTYSSSGFFAARLPTEPDYYDDKYNLTESLNYTSWNKLFVDYTHADVSGNILIKFFRNDERNVKIVKRFHPKRIRLDEIHQSNVKVEDLSYLRNVKIPDGRVYPVIPFRDLPFCFYKETIFDESIWVRASRVNIKVHLTLDGYVEDNALMMQVVYRVTPSFWFSNSGITLEVNNLGNLILGNW